MVGEIQNDVLTCNLQSLSLKLTLLWPVGRFKNGSLTLSFKDDDLLD